MRRALLPSIAACIAACAVVLFARPSRAEKAKARLVYVRGAGAETCPDEAAVRSSVAARLGFDPFSDDAPRTIAVAVVRPKGVFQAKIEVRDASGKTKGARRLDSKGSDCEELAQAITLAISIAVDPFAGTTPSDPLPLPPATNDDASADAATTNAGTNEDATDATSAPIADDTATAPKIDENSPDFVPEEKRELRVLAGGGVVSSTGFEPGIGVGAFVGFALRWPRFSLGVEGRVDVPGEKTLPQGGVRSGVLLGTILPCVHRGIALACAEGVLGAIRSSGVGDAAKSQSDPFVAAGARIGVEVPLGTSVLARFTLDGVATILGARLQFGGQEVWQSPSFAGALGGAIVGAF